MSGQSYAKALDQVLRPMGFKRHGQWWCRTVDTMLERVNLQTSSTGGKTVNLYSKDLATEKLLCEVIPELDPPGMVEFGTRIGDLMRGKDKWWRNDPDGPQELAEAISVHAPAFFEGRRSLEAQATLFGRSSKKFAVASLRIYLALTLYRMGQMDEALHSLADPPKTMPASWRPKVEGVRRWLSARRDAEQAQHRH